jgi:hypothetical protein
MKNGWFEVLRMRKSERKRMRKMNNDDDDSYDTI